MQLKDTAKIKVLVTRNPKRGKSAIRFGLHRNGQTVKQYIEKSVEAGNSRAMARADLQWEGSTNLSQSSR